MEVGHDLVCTPRSGPVGHGGFQELTVPFDRTPYHGNKVILVSHWRFFFIYEKYHMNHVNFL